MSMPTPNSTPEELQKFYAAFIGKGNPGAITVAAQLAKMDGGWAMLGALLFHDCVGPELWIAYKDRHGCDIEALAKTIMEDRKP